MNFITRKIALANNLLLKSPDWPKYYLDYLRTQGTSWLFRTQEMKFVIRSNTVDKWIVAENVIMDSYKLESLQKMNFDQVFDVGANIGAFSILAAHYFQKAKIMAFEPDKQNIKQLKRNIEANNLSKRVTVIDRAFSVSRSPTLKLYKGNDFGSTSTFVSSKNYKVVKNFHFLKISKLIKDNALLKMDIEGGEIEFFKKKYLKFLRKFKMILVEYHHFLKTHSAEKFEKFLTENGFKYSKDDLIYIIKSKRKTKI